MLGDLALFPSVKHDCSPALVCNMHVTTVGPTPANVVDVNRNLTLLITTEHLSIYQPHDKAFLSSIFFKIENFYTF